MNEKETTNNEIERRFTTEVVELRADGDSRLVEGYAAVFERWSGDLGGFKEIISRGAFEGVVQDSDVLALLNHNQDRGLLARSQRGKGTLTLTVDEKGLKYSFEAPHSVVGDELLEGIRRGDITASSFAFTVESETWENDYKERRINKVRALYDVSPVYRPAYPSTSVALSKRDARKSLDAYYQKLKDKIK